MTDKTVLQCPPSLTILFFKKKLWRESVLEKLLLNFFKTSVPWSGGTIGVKCSKATSGIKRRANGQILCLFFPWVNKAIITPFFLRQKKGSTAFQRSTPKTLASWMLRLRCYNLRHKLIKVAAWPFRNKITSQSHIFDRNVSPAECLAERRVVHAVEEKEIQTCQRCKQSGPSGFQLFGKQLQNAAERNIYQKGSNNTGSHAEG